MVYLRLLPCCFGPSVAFCHHAHLVCIVACICWQQAGWLCCILPASHSNVSKMASLPCRHYIPVQTSSSPDAKVKHLNLAEMVRWAEKNPSHVEAIVEEAHRFADLHLSRLGQTCYMARLLLAYSALVKQDAEQPVNMTTLPSMPPVAETLVLTRQPDLPYPSPLYVCLVLILLSLFLSICIAILLCILQYGHVHSGVAVAHV